jgi:hypothetical protein
MVKECSGTMDSKGNIDTIRVRTIDGLLELRNPLNVFGKTEEPIEMPKGSNKPPDLLPVVKVEEVLREFYTVIPGAANQKEAIKEVALKTKYPINMVTKIVTNDIIRQEAKEQRRKYADAIYEDKITVIKTIVGVGLEGVLDFIKNNKPKDYNEARTIVSMATDLTKLLRLEMGQTTQKVELVHTQQKDITVILDELQQTDPFVDYMVEVAKEGDEGEYGDGDDEV